jgi:hypothetical protein
MSNAELSSEARVLRWLIGNYIAKRLWQQNLRVPDKLVNDEPLALMHGSDLLAAFGRALDMFIEDNDSTLDALIRKMPQTKADIRECIMEVNRESLTYGDVTWSRMVAVVALLTKFAPGCIHYEMPELLVQLAEHAAALSDEHLAQFIRENGGWAVFVLAFPKKRAVGNGWLIRLVRRAVEVACAFVGFGDSI